MQERLAQVDVAPIPGRVGQRIRNELIFQATGGGEALPPTHRLEVVLAEIVTSTLVKVDGDALGPDLRGPGQLPAGRHQGARRSCSRARAMPAPASSASQSIYSNVRAREDAENRAAQDHRRRSQDPACGLSVPRGLRRRPLLHHSSRSASAASPGSATSLALS